MIKGENSEKSLSSKISETSIQKPDYLIRGNVKRKIVDSNSEVFNNRSFLASLKIFLYSEIYQTSTCWTNQWISELDLSTCYRHMKRNNVSAEKSQRSINWLNSFEYKWIITELPISVTQEKLLQFNDHDEATQPTNAYSV